MEQKKEGGQVFSVSTDLVCFGPYQVDRRSGRVCKDHLRIRLSRQPFEVLNLLLERPGDIVTREEIRQRLWAADTFVDFEHSLNSAVKKLRRALDDDPQNPRYIQTLPTRGYRFIGAIERPASAAAAAKNVNLRSSLAVLGFKNLSSRHDADWLSTAITQMLSTELASGGKVRIIPAATVARAKIDFGLDEKSSFPRDILRALRIALGVNYVVTGSYVALREKNSRQVRMDFHLQETISGEILATVAVSGKQSGIFHLVGQAGQEMCGKLGFTVPWEGDVDWRTVLPSNPDAARLYSKGLARLRVFENRAARKLLQESIAIEPDFALGHAALAEAWLALGYEAQGAAAAQKALALSGSLPEDERFKIEGRYYELHHDWAGAIGVYRQLWQDFPDDLESGLGLAAAQTSAGNFNEALATLSSLRAIPAPQRDDPRIDLAEASVAARSADYKRQQACAEEAARKAQFSGARLLLARARLTEGRALSHQSKLEEAMEAYSAARQIFEEANDRDGTAIALNGAGVVLWKQGDLSGAREKIEQARDYFRQVGNENGFGAASRNLGALCRARGELIQAEALYRESLDTFRKTGRKEHEYATLNDLSGVLYQLGNFRDARQVYEGLLEARGRRGAAQGSERRR